MYEYRDGAFKHLFDSPLWFSYPNLVAPAIHDSGSSKILGYDANVWEYAYLRYRDPNYLTLLKEIPQRIHSRYQIFAESVLWDLDKDQLAPPIAVGSTNLHGVGYGITRVNSAELGQQYLLLDYGPNRSHGHPDKLNIDLWVNGEQLIIDPGMVWYEQPMYRRWFNKSIAHNTLIVDETDQRASGAVQTVFASGETVAMQRAYATDAVPGVTMDRTLFMFERYVIDIFGAFAKMPRLYDLAWHIRGDFTLPEGMKEREKFTAVGYVELDEVKKLTTKDGFSVGFTSPEKGSRSRFFAAPGVETTFITGLGHYGKERPLTIIARRNVADTIFASAVDYSGTGDYVKSITGSGDVTKGFYLAKAVTQSGTDLAYTSFNGVKNTADTLTTDALQALVRFDDKDAVYTAAIAGGTTLTNGAFALELSDKGIVIVERTLAGTWLINNQLDTEVTLTLKADFTKGLNIVALNADGSHGKAAPAAFTGTIMLPALGKFELLPAGNDGYFKTALKIRAEAQAAAEKAAVEAKAIAEARAKERRDAAAAAPVTGFRVEIPAIAFTAETGGTVKKLTDRAATQTKEGIVQGWQGAAHALTWEVEAPAAGYYILGARYCTEMKDPVREIKINGEVQEPLSPFIFPTTGGWARSNDDWKFAYALDSVDGKPLLLKLTAGKNTITLTSNDGLGVNLDFLVVASPDAAAIAK